MSRNTFAYTDAQGRRLLSVSEVLKEGGLVDFRGVPRETLELARQRGVDVHSWIEGLATGILDDDLVPDPRIAGYIDGWREFVAATGFRATHVEEPVINRTLGYAGTLDLMGNTADPPTWWLIDVKATAAVPATGGPQTWAYKAAWIDSFASLPPADESRRRRAILHLPGDGKWALHECRNDGEDRRIFLAALVIAKWRREHGLGARLED